MSDTTSPPIFAEDLSREERKAFAQLSEVAAKWPSTLWIFAADGVLNIMRKRDDQRVMTSRGGVDQAFCFGTVSIESDGGDW